MDKKLHILCICRTCRKRYHESKSSADYKGYCSNKCLHIKSKQLGYKKLYQKWAYALNAHSPNSEYSILKNAGQIGSIYVT